jgi:hypothetical protein
MTAEADGISRQAFMNKSRYHPDILLERLWKTTKTSVRIAPRILPIESFAHDSGQTLVCAEHSYPKGSPYTNS